MVYSDEDKERILKFIFEEIAKGSSLRSVIRDNENMPDRTTVKEWIDKEEKYTLQYAYAREERAESIFEDILEIADEADNDYVPTLIGETEVGFKFNSENVQRSRLKIDSRKWMLGKMNPKKYGEKLDVTTDGEKINTVTIFELPNDGRNG